MDMKLLLVCIAVLGGVRSTPIFQNLFGGGDDNDDSGKQRCFYGFEDQTVTRYETVYTQQCHDTYVDKCETSYETKCSTVYTSKQEQECSTVTETSYETKYETACETVYQTVCTSGGYGSRRRRDSGFGTSADSYGSPVAEVSNSYGSPVAPVSNSFNSGGGFGQSCSQEPKQECTQVPKQVAVNKPKEVCKYVNRNVPQQQCSQIPRESCSKVPSQSCAQVPHQVPRRSRQRRPRLVCMVPGRQSGGQYNRVGRDVDVDQADAQEEDLERQADGTLVEDGEEGRDGGLQGVLGGILGK